MMNMATWPPPHCRLCEVHASVVGMELTKATRLIQRVCRMECACSLWYGSHEVAHPHASPITYCPGIRGRRNDSDDGT
jgi:hypothetical protein